MAITIIGRKWSESDATNASIGLPISALPKDGSASTAKAQPRSMVQVMSRNGAALLNYNFPAPPAQFSHEGFGAEYNEIRRPYNTPLVDVTTAKSRRASFEFPIIQPVNMNVTPVIYKDTPLEQNGRPVLDRDGTPLNRYGQRMSQSTNASGKTDYLSNYLFDVEAQISRLVLMADMAMPLKFVNFHDSLTNNYWYIDNVSFTHTRVNTDGKTVSATCSMSLLEYQEVTSKFILLPRISYSKYSTGSKTEKAEKKKEYSDVEYWTNN